MSGASSVSGAAPKLSHKHVSAKCTRFNSQSTGRAFRHDEMDHAAATQSMQRRRPPDILILFLEKAAVGFHCPQPSLSAHCHSVRSDFCPPRTPMLCTASSSSGSGSAAATAPASAPSGSAPSGSTSGSATAAVAAAAAFRFFFAVVFAAVAFLAAARRRLVACLRATHSASTRPSCLTAARPVLQSTGMAR